jgi:hypothetical protein
MTRRMVSSAGHVGSVRDTINAYGILAGNRERKRPLRRLTPVRRDNIKIYLKDIRYENVVGVQVDQNSEQGWALVNN